MVKVKVYGTHAVEWWVNWISRVAVGLARQGALGARSPAASTGATWPEVGGWSGSVAAVSVSVLDVDELEGRLADSVDVHLGVLDVPEVTE